MPASMLQRLHVSGFRSLREVRLEFSPVTVVIGANGSGKSNLLSVLRMISLMRTRSLRRFVGEQGGASTLLHYGASTTKTLALELQFEAAAMTSTYSALLGYAAGDSFIYLHELVTSGGDAQTLSAQAFSSGGGHAESKLEESAKDQPEVKAVEEQLAGLGFFHFHDTSPTSPLRQSSRQSEDRTLQPDGSNLAAFLYRLRASEAEDARKSWSFITSLARRVAPFIKELIPDLVDPSRPEQSAIRLYWTDERDHRFDVHDLSDGTLRAIALFTALGQPSATRPAFITIYEPELGLHPAAVSVFASLVRSVSEHSQILLATQSPALLDEFEPEDVVVTERVDGASTFRRLSSTELSDWLEDYSLSELYDKNVLGGRP